MRFGIARQVEMTQLPENGVLGNYEPIQSELAKMRLSRQFVRSTAKSRFRELS